MAQEDVPIAFFSYCREDSEFALKLAADLKVAGAQVWIDQLDIEPGTPWDRAVEAALTNSPRMLVVLSPVSVNSDNVRDEVSFALSRQKRVIPVLYRDCDVPFRLARLQHIDFRPDYARALSILVRALGVGQAAHSPVASGGEVAAEGAVSASELEEKTQQHKLDDERRLADEQAQLAETRKYATEQKRLREAREAAAQAARAQEQQRTAAVDRASQEQSRREQRVAEQARLEEEARLAAERVRLAQQEKERREAEIKARQEQLRREEEESVERKSLVLETDPQSERQATKPEPHPIEASPNAAPAAEPARPAVAVKPMATPPVIKPPVIEPPVSRQPELRVPPLKEPQATGLNLASPKYLAGGAILLIVLGLIIFLVAHRGGPEKPPESAVTQNKPAETAAVQPPKAQPSTEKPPSAAPSGAPKQDQVQEKTKPAATDKDVANAKNPAPPGDLSASNLSAGGSPNAAKEANTNNAANIAAAPNRVRVSQGISHGMLMHEVKPAYPPLARSAHVQGQVVLDVVIGKDGSVTDIKAESGHPLLVPAAIDAVKQWRYKPYKLDGKPIVFDTQVLVNFTLTN